jgi:CubicO group peptidase (beta-lactamase class C family)
MTTMLTNNAKAAALIALALVIGAIGIYVGEADDAPGAAVMGLLVMLGGVAAGARAARNRLPTWAAATAFAVGVVMVAFAAFVIRAAAVTAPLFAQAEGVPSVVDSAPSPRHAAAVERARELVRAAIREQNLAGVSVAVGADGTVVWAEGFGWRDVDTQAPVTPKTRFNIGTAASAFTAADVATLGLTDTGAEPAAAWSPEAIGEPGEDFPPLTLIRHNILQPLGLAPAEYPLPGNRATFYVPRSDDNPSRGRRLMYMRDLACCAGTMASYSTASDLVRVGLARGGTVNGELAGGMVTSLMTLGDKGIVVAVLSNIAHANTAALAMKIRDAFGN